MYQFLINLAFYCTKLKFVSPEKYSPFLPNVLTSVVYLVLCGDVEGSVCWHCVAVLR